VNYGQAKYIKHPIDNGFDGVFPDLSFLKGTEILNIGWLDVKDGLNKLAIDYEDSDDHMRVVFVYTDRVFCIEWHGMIGEKNKKDVLKEKILDAMNILNMMDNYFVDTTNGLTFKDVGGNTVLHMTNDDIIMAGIEDKVRESKNKIADADDNDVYKIVMGLDWFSGT